MPNPINKINVMNLNLINNTIVPLIVFCAVLVFIIKVYLYFKLENPNKNYLFAYANGTIIPYVLLSFFPISTKNRTGDKKNVRIINRLTYLLYFLIFIGFALGLIMNL